MKKLILNKWGEDHHIQFEISKYITNGNLAVSMLEIHEDYYEPWSILTVNLGCKCAPNCAFIDTNNNGDDIVEWLIENELGKPTGRYDYSGWCEYPEFEFNMENLRKYAMEE